MDINAFWEIIDRVRTGCGKMDSIYDMTDPMIDALAELELEDILVWHNIFWEYQSLSYKEKLWAAAYVINGGCSDDGFDYFRGWLTAMGRDVFHKALADPDSLADVEDACEDETNFEDMLGVALNAWHKKQGLTERDYDAYYAECDKHPLSEATKAAMLAGITYAADIDCEWDEDEGLEDIVPKLCVKFDW